MRVIGVIDLHDGRAVHAKGGRRNRYLPVQRAGNVPVNGDPVRLAQFYLDVCGLDELYVADLDAITGGTLQGGALEGIAAVGGSLWLDAGVTTADAARAALAAGAKRVIVGIETLPNYEVLDRICADIMPSRVILSLDLREGNLVCRADSPIANESIESVASYAWRTGIATLVVLDLNRIGGNEGPAWREIGRVREAVPEAAIYVGGGIGSPGDLQELQAIGVTGALIASALHDGRLTPASLHPILTR